MRDLNMASPRDSKSLSVTRWIEELEKGDTAAAELLWQFMESRLMSLANKRVGFSISYDENDVALDAFATLCDGIQKGKYELDDRNALWSLLAVITINGARKLSRDEKRLRRGGGFTKSQKNDQTLKALSSHEHSPDASFFAKEECKRLLSMLPDENLKRLAVLKVDGYTNDEIASILGCTRRSIQRRLNLIRETWTDDFAE